VHDSVLDLSTFHFLGYIARVLCVCITWAIFIAKAESICQVFDLRI